MDIFLTWSGEPSKSVALALRDTLPLICNAFHPWMSDQDIAKGAPWFPEITNKLASCSAGILCLTPSNQDERWVLFEAGAVAKAVKTVNPLVVPYLFGLAPADLKPPLREFQAVTSALDKEQNWKLVKDFHSVLEDKERAAMPPDRLKEAFDMTWDAKLQPRLDGIKQPPPAPAAKTPDAAAETLTLVRELIERDRRRAAQEDAFAKLSYRVGRLDKGTFKGRLAELLTDVDFTDRRGSWQFKLRQSPGQPDSEATSPDDDKPKDEEQD